MPAQTFEKSYLDALDARLQRSEVVGAVTLEKRSAALFHDPTDSKFTLVEKLANVEEASVFDSIPREQWGRLVMLFGHATNTGGYIASGHGSLTGNTFSIKLASGHHYRFEVDATLAHLQPYFVEAPAPKPKTRPVHARKADDAGPREARPPHPPRRAPARTAAPATHDAGGEHEDFTEEDLRRLRGEIPLTAKKRRY